MALSDRGRPAHGAPRAAARTETGPGSHAYTYSARRAPTPGDPALRVDPIGCQAHGLCAELLPGYVGLDEWGYPIVPAGPVPPGLRAAARAAVRACPTLALRLGTE